MGFDLSVGISAVTVFLQGLLSVFSPCVLPLIPLYIGYLAGGTAAVQPDGTIRYPRRRVLVNTLFFVLGISFAFFLLGMGFTALGRFFSGNRTLFTRCSGVLILVFGLYQLGIFGRSSAMDSEHRFHLPLNRLAMNPLTALLLGFTFSFAWTPCVGPALSGVLLMASSAPERGFLLIGVYTLGFVIPFLLVGLFTGTVLDLFKKYHNVVRYTTRIGAVLLILMGLMTLTGFTGRLSGVLSQTGGSPSASSGAAPQVTATPAPTEEPETDPDAIPAPDFTLVDQYGEEHTLSEYRGKTVFLNFWATWCGPCQSEMPEIQSLYEFYGRRGPDRAGRRQPQQRRKSPRRGRQHRRGQRIPVGQRLHLPGGHGHHRRCAQRLRHFRLPDHLHDRHRGQRLRLCDRSADRRHDGEHRHPDHDRAAGLLNHNDKTPPQILWVLIRK